MRISDWSSDVCSSDLPRLATAFSRTFLRAPNDEVDRCLKGISSQGSRWPGGARPAGFRSRVPLSGPVRLGSPPNRGCGALGVSLGQRYIVVLHWNELWRRSEEHTSELQSLMRISYAVFSLKKK